MGHPQERHGHIRASPPSSWKPESARSPREPVPEGAKPRILRRGGRRWKGLWTDRLLGACEPAALRGSCVGCFGPYGPYRQPAHYALTGLCDAELPRDRPLQGDTGLAHRAPKFQERGGREDSFRGGRFWKQGEPQEASFPRWAPGPLGGAPFPGGRPLLSPHCLAPFPVASHPTFCHCPLFN